MSAEISSENTRQNPTEILTFICFDLNATGPVRKSYMPKMTEISFVAVSRESLVNKAGTLPRVIKKLVMPVRPMRPFTLEVTKKTGLRPNALKSSQPFDDAAYDYFKFFIGRFRSPICFVSHNGNKSNYPIFLSELSRLGKTLSEDILCVDSLEAFQILLDRNDSTDAEASVSSETAENIVEGEGRDANVEESMLDTNLSKKFKKNDGSCSEEQSLSNRKKPANFRLATVYEHLVGVAPPDCRCAESNCLNLLNCMIKLHETFIPWADLNATPLCDVQ